MNKDLTEGKAEKVLWAYCIPLLGSILFQQLYNIADSLVAGKFIGENALAAVGNSYEITLIYIAFAFGCNIGCSVVVSQLFGAKKWQEMKTSVSTTFIASGILCILLMTLGFVFCGALLQLIHTPGEIFADSMLYLKIYTAGLLFQFFYNIATGVFSAMGDSRTPFYFLAVSSTANIFVDILFVKAFDMGIAGVAWATFLCQGVSCVLAMIALIKRLKMIPHGEGSVPFFSWRLLGNIAVIAIPSILQQSFISVGNIIIQSVINGYGASVIAGYAASVKLNNLVITTFTTLGNGVSSFAAQNLGAGKLKRIKNGFAGGLKMIYLLCVPVVLLYFFFGRVMVHIFMDTASGPAMDTGIMFLKIVSPFYFVVATKLVADGILRGAGSMGRFMAATFTDLILRVIFAIVLSKEFGATGIWMAWPLGWTIAAVMSVLFYIKGGWMKKWRKLYEGSIG